MMRLVLLIVALSAPALVAQEYPALHSVTGVAAGDVLNIREAPDAGAPVIGSLAPGATGVEVIGISDGWALVNTADLSGYAALRYLRRDSGPDWNALERPLICLGTEPFWSLDIDPAKGEARYNTPEDATPQLLKIGDMWPGSPWATSAALALPEGLAVLSRADCSDGMSERSYGIGIDIFLQSTGRQRLSGCCLLALP